MRRNWYDVRDFGAAAPGLLIATKAIQQAIDQCAADGGGTVYFGPGQYVSGLLLLKTNVTIYLEAGAVLQASRNSEDFQPRTDLYRNHQVTPEQPCLFFADSVRNVSIVGKGTIDGRAEHIWDTLRGADSFIDRETSIARAAGITMRRFYALDPKVRLVFINRAKDITVKDVQIRNSPDWALHIGNADNVVIDGVTILSSLEKGVNSDGIDIDGCRNVRIASCYVSTGDDAICLKSTNRSGFYSPCENIVISNCTLESTSSGLKIGTETHGDFRGVIFSNCVIRNTNRGICIVVRDGGTVENILFTNLLIDCNRKHFNWWGDGDPIRFILLKRTIGSRLGKIRNITVRNVWAKGQGTSLLQGHPKQALQEVTLENVTLIMERETLPDHRATDILQISRANGVNISNVNLAWADSVSPQKGWRAALYVANTSQLFIDRLFLKKTFSRGQQVVMDGVDGALVDRVYAHQVKKKALWKMIRTRDVRFSKPVLLHERR